MASNIPDLLQVSTCGINHALRSGRDASRTWHPRPTSPASTRKKNFQNKLNTSGKWTAINKPVVHEKREHITMYDPFIIGKIMLWLAPINFVRSQRETGSVSGNNKFVLARKKMHARAFIVPDTKYFLTVEVLVYFILFQLSTLRLRII